VLAGDRLSDETFDCGELAALLGSSECNGVTCPTGPGGTADPVDVVFRHVGQVEVDHMADIVDVKPSCGDVSRDEGIDIAPTKTSEGPGTSRLALVGMDCGHSASRFLEVPDELISSCFGSSENQRLTDVLALKQGLKQVSLPRHSHRVNDLTDGAHRHRPRGDLNEHRFLRRSADEVLYLTWHGGRKEEVLAPVWQRCEDTANVRQEAHVEHAVRFVEDNHLDVTQVDLLATQMIEKSTRRRNQEVEAGRQAARLRLHSSAAENDGAAHVQVLAVTLRHFAVGGGNLARGRYAARTGVA
jgi:hypothetical protein